MNTSLSSDVRKRRGVVLNERCFWLSFKTLVLIAVYFTLSIGITFYQRWILKELHFPLSIVVCHMSIKYVLGGVCRCAWQGCGSKQVQLEWGPYTRKVGPTGIAGGLDIGLSNWGLNLITVSLYTMIKSTVIVFILIFALLFRLERKSWTLVLIVMMISSGLFAFTYKATEFSWEGFLLVLAASFTSGLRWTLAQVLMQKAKLGLSHPLDMIYHVQPWMILSLLPLAIIFEGKMLATSCHVFRYSNVDILSVTIGKVLLGAVVAFLMELSEFLLISQTSSLTFSVAGIFKEIVTLVLAVEWAGDPMNFTKYIGLALCLGGISFHSYRKMLVVPAETPKEDESVVRDIHEYELTDSDIHMPLLSDPGGIDESFFANYESSSGIDAESDDDSTVLFTMQNYGHVR